MIDELSLSCPSGCLVKMLAVSLNILVIETRIRDFYPPARRRTSSPVGEGTQQIFTRGGSAPRLNPLPFYLPFLSEKGPLSYTSYRKKALSFLEDESITYHWKFFYCLAPVMWALSQTAMTDFFALSYTSTGSPWSLPFHGISVVSPTLRSIRLHDRSRFANTVALEGR